MLYVICPIRYSIIFYRVLYRINIQALQKKANIFLQIIALLMKEFMHFCRSKYCNLANVRSIVHSTGVPKGI
jgi:hypothetical protein